MHLLWRCLFLFVVFFCCPALCNSAFNNVSDQQSLLSFKGSITYDPYDVLGNWVPNITFCNWTGVKCSSDNQRVTSLTLKDMQLEGFISAFLGNLSHITLLDLFNNSLHGEIPYQLGRLHLLSNLSLAVNKLGGSIPPALGGCHSLVVLSLSDNHLKGSIPSALGLLTNLRSLRLVLNNLTGTIPSSFGNLSSLNDLLLGSNSFDGHIPPELGSLSQLKRLYLFENHLAGPIPSSLSNISTLTELALYSNNLVGAIPSELGKLTQLTVLYLWGNRLSGSIPSSLANCSQLADLLLDFNRLSGMVPTELGKLSNLQVLGLADNHLVSGSTTSLPILTALSNCSLLQSLYFSVNRLTGVLDQFPPNLSVLTLNNNSISGKIPQQIGNLTGLSSQLDLSFNLFTGRIPSAFGRLQKLERLFLDNNKLEGSLPSEIGEMKNLGELSVSLNVLSGRIPDSIGNLQKLRYLVLHSNHLSGSIPNALGNCSALEKLDLCNNRLSGEIPHEVAGLPNLLLYFNLSRNSLQGSLPFEIGQMIHVIAIDISSNRLSNHIPATLGSCAGLQYLNLSRNRLRGPIPNSLGNLKSVEVLDLSWNRLSGSIPESLERLTMLHRLNLSFNNLSGEIPKERAFANLSTASFMGNPSLCIQGIHSPSCSILTPKKQNHSSSHKRIIAAVAGSVAFVLLCCLFVGFTWKRLLCTWKRLREQNIDLSNVIPLKHGLRRVSYEELARATNEFSATHLLGVGSFGSVYKGTFSNGTVSAIKILNLQNKEANKSFTTECRVLGRVKHRNLVKITACFSNHHSKALILQFMSNGSLERCLYPDGNEESACGLSFMDRLNIAIDVGHGMEYLHHDCYVQVVHCDLKPSNVLLDDNMTAHVADFGIARLICEDSMDALSSTLALRGSIGYIAPEYGLQGRVSTKGDVYSYGIVLLEMLTRKKPTDDMFLGETNLQRWVSVHFPNGVVEVVDCNLLKRMSDEGMDEEDMRNCLIPFIHVGLLCTKESPQERPTMRQVVWTLQGIRGNLIASSRASVFPPLTLTTLLPKE